MICIYIYVHATLWPLCDVQALPKGPRKHDYYCTRGSSPLEGYHLQYNELIKGYFLSVQYTQALLSDFNHQWNDDMGIDHRGEPTTAAHT